MCIIFILFVPFFFTAKIHSAIDKVSNTLALLTGHVHQAKDALKKSRRKKENKHHAKKRKVCAYNSNF